MNNKYFTFSIFLMLFLSTSSLFVSAVSDLSIDGAIFDKNNPTFGDKDQRASNPLHDDGSVIITASKTIIFKNNGVDPLSNFIATFTPSGQYNLVSSNIILTDAPAITAGSTGGLAFDAKIPEDLDAVDTAFEAVAFKVGILRINATDLNEPLIFDVFMQRKNLLEISDSDAEVNSKGSENIDDKDNIEGIRPGDNIELTAEAENNFDQDDDVDMENVDIVLECADDGDLDINDKTIDIGDLGPEDKQEDTFDIGVEEDAEDGDISCDIQMAGIDQNGARHGESIGFTIEVQRESHDIQIKMPILTTPQVISCSDSSIQLAVSILNLGRSNEDEVAVEVTSTEIGFQDRRSNIELDEDDSSLETFSVPLTETDISGINPLALTVRTFYDNVKTSDTEVVLVENACTSNTGGNNGGPGPSPVTGIGTLTLTEDFVSTSQSKFNSVAVQVTNTDAFPATFEVSVSDINDFATASSAKSVLLQPGQTSTIFLNFRTKPDTDSGTYTGKVNLMSAGQLVDSLLFTIEVTGEKEETGTGLNLGLDSTKVFWIIGDVILIIIAIFFIRLIFTSGKRKRSEMKMADFEASARRQRKPSRGPAKA